MHIHRDTVITQDTGQCQHCSRKVTRVLVSCEGGGRAWWSVDWDEPAKMWRVHEHAPEPTRKVA